MTDTLVGLGFILCIVGPALVAALVLKIKERIVARLGEKAKKRFTNALWSILTVFCAIVIISFLIFTVIIPRITMAFHDSSWAYEAQYDTESQYVVLDKQPHDCEFFTAPIGSKHCHYERLVTAREGDESVHHKTLVNVTWDRISE